jgi:pantoate--beta-alanine ligase
VELIREAAALRARTDRWRASEETVGLVPTMGSLHEGHASLIERARAETGRVVVTIFVNPLQFGPDEDYERYPRDEARDLRWCERLGADVVWAPSVEEVYPPGFQLPSPDPGPVGAVLEGASRPGHFAGVLKVVRRLFDVAGPCRAYFGEKDAQQLYLVRRMVRQDDLPVEVVGCPTVREADGLARSSRNAYLGPEEREQAGCLFLALAEAAGLARAGERDAEVVVATMAREIGATPLARLEYAAVVDDATFEPVSRIDGPARAVVAARFPSARLLDNLLLPAPAGDAGSGERLSRPDTVGEAEPTEPVET